MKTSTNKVLAVLLGACLVHGIAFATETTIDSMAAGQIGKVYFKTVDRNTTPMQLNKGTFQLTDTISGDLLLPSGTGPFPVMVVAHGSGGVSKFTYSWAEFFLARGIGAFVVDSFKGRGIENSISDQSQMTYPASAGDNLVALKLLATNPRVNPNKIGIIGFSRGGVASFATAFETWRNNVVQGPTKYVVHLPFYGGCSTMVDRYDGSPIYQFIGDSDDMNLPISVCYAQKPYLTKAGVNYTLTVYPGTKHGFDNNDLPRDIYMARAQTMKNCSYLWNMESQVFYSPADSSQARPLSELRQVIDACKTIGATFGPNRKASDDAHAKVAQIVTETLLAK